MAQKEKKFAKNKKKCKGEFKKAAKQQTEYQKERDALKRKNRGGGETIVGSLQKQDYTRG